MTQNTFIELDYTGRVDGAVFDTTRKEDAPAGSKTHFKPVVVKLGAGQLIPGLDKYLADKKPGTYDVSLKAEEAFGNKRSDLLKLVPATMFGKEKGQIQIGLPVRFGEQQGVIKSISGGRVVVDFNHPLAGKDVTYHVILHGEVKEPKRKVEAILAAMGIPLPVEEKEGKVTVSLPKGFPAEGFVKEIEAQTGVQIAIHEVEMKHDHAHDHAHDHSHEHGHDHAHGHDHHHH
jgi:FKBP-type peptidyl-prolyl cis-trans isomerase 2